HPRTNESVATDRYSSQLVRGAEDARADEVVMPLNAGSRLGPYEIQSALGAGGMGEVYKARDTRLDRTVAIKILPDTLAADPQFRERFDREAKAISHASQDRTETLAASSEEHRIASPTCRFELGSACGVQVNKTVNVGLLMAICLVSPV